MLRLFVILLALIAGTLTYARPINRTVQLTSGYPAGVTVPPQAAQWGYTKLVFYDDFSDSSNVDWGNQRIPGFKWYVNNRFQLTSSAYGQWSQATPTPNDPNYLYRFKGGLTLFSNTISSATIESLGNCYANPNAGPLSGTTVGLSITGGYYTQVTMQVDNTTHSLAASWPAYFFGGPAFWNGAFNAGGSLAGTEAVEVDVVENVPSSGTGANHVGTPQPKVNMHHWIFTTGENDTLQQYVTDTFFGQVAPGLTATINMNLSHSYGTLLVTSAQTTSGLAFQQHFLDGALSSWIVASAGNFLTGIGETFSPATEPSPILATSGIGANFSQVGFLTTTEADTKCFILATGRNWPATFTNIQVWQHP